MGQKLFVPIDTPLTVTDRFENVQKSKRYTYILPNFQTTNTLIQEYRRVRGNPPLPQQDIDELITSLNREYIDNPTLNKKEKRDRTGNSTTISLSSGTLGGIVDMAERIYTIGDGSCFFHAFLQCACEDYRTGPSSFKKEMVHLLRKLTVDYMRFTDIYNKMAVEGRIDGILQIVTLDYLLHQKLKQNLVNGRVDTETNDRMDTFVHQVVKDRYIIKRETNEEFFDLFLNAENDEEAIQLFSYAYLENMINRNTNSSLNADRYTNFLLNLEQSTGNDLKLVVVALRDKKGYKLRLEAGEKNTTQTSFVRVFSAYPGVPEQIVEWLRETITTIVRDMYIQLKRELLTPSTFANESIIKICHKYLLYNYNIYIFKESGLLLTKISNGNPSNRCVFLYLQGEIHYESMVITEGGREYYTLQGDDHTVKIIDLLTRISTDEQLTNE